MIETYSIVVDFKQTQDAYFFSSKYPLAHGLCVASKNFNKGYEEVSKQLKVLFEKNNLLLVTDVGPTLTVETARGILSAGNISTVSFIWKVSATSMIKPAANDNKYRFLYEL